MYEAVLRELLVRDMDNKNINKIYICEKCKVLMKL
jgi:hypothetical protein